MKRSAFSIDAMSGGQQFLLTLVLVVAALLAGSALFLVFALPNNWLVPSPTNVYERNIIAAQQAADEARTQYGEGILADGTNPYAEAAAQVVQARLDARQYDLALSEAESLYARYPDTIPVGYVYARALFETERLTESEEVIVTLLAGAPTGPPELTRALNYLQSRILIAQGNREGALDPLMTAARIAPASYDYFIEAAQIAHEIGQVDRAASAYALALAYNPDDETAHQALSMIRNENGAAFEAAMQTVEDEVGIDLRSRFQ